jgi:tight adherence protein C
LGFDAALSKVIKNTKGPLAEEFFRMLQEITLGSSRRDAFKRLSERTTVPELQGFILAMLQADIFGISVSKVLRIQAREMRIKRRQKAEETAMKAPVKMVFPLILCIFPALLVIVLGPAVIKIYTAFMQSL